MNEIRKIQVPVHQLNLGMYVSELDKPWLETPFLTQGFLIKTESDIEEVAAHCEFVYIDTQRGAALPCALPNQERISSLKDRPREIAEKNRSSLANDVASNSKNCYPKTTSLAAEMNTAVEVFHRLNTEIVELAGLLRRGSAMKVGTLTELVPTLVDSVTRNPDASIWLAQLKSKSDYTYRHCLSVSVWCTVIGRQLELPKEQLTDLALGGLLLDIGKLKMPKKLLELPRKLTSREYSLVQKHIDVALYMVREAGVTLSPVVSEIIKHHHERWDGSGYPQGLKGAKIPLFARIAGIADTYDAITSRRAYAHPVPHVTAIKRLYSWRNSAFQDELVRAFIQSVGLYPIGTLVECTSGEIGVVVEENAGERLRPTLLMLLDKEKNPLVRRYKLDLAKAEGVSIYHSLEPGAYGLVPAAIDFSVLDD